jgi:hypothetical protein
MDLNLVQDFIEAINTANIDRLYELMCNDHEFIDSRGNHLVGRDNIKIAWAGYFELFPDYKVEISDMLQNDTLIVLLGYASGTYQYGNTNTDNSNYWRIPASWKAKVVDDKIQLWQVYADTSVVAEIVNRNRYKDNTPH